MSCNRMEEHERRLIDRKRQRPRRVGQSKDSPEAELHKAGAREGSGHPRMGRESAFGQHGLLEAVLCGIITQPDAKQRLLEGHTAIH